MTDIELQDLVHQEINIAIANLYGNVSEKNNTFEKIEQNKIEAVKLNIDDTTSNLFNNTFYLPDFGKKSFIHHNLDFISYITNNYNRKKIIIITNTGNFLCSNVSINNNYIYILFTKIFCNYENILTLDDIKNCENENLKNALILKNLIVGQQLVYCIADCINNKVFYKLIDIQQE